jgi:Cytochrome C oxidase, cbb3-type, subunit III
VPPGDIGKGLYPAPPDLKLVAARYTPSEIFWIIKHGITSTGMPSWEDHNDAEIWAIVAFLEKLQHLDEDGYCALVMQSIMQGGGHHHDSMPMDHSTMPETEPQPAAPASPHG